MRPWASRLPSRTCRKPSRSPASLRSSTVDYTVADQLRPRDACVAAERSGHVVAARSDTVDRPREGRCRRQHCRHTNELLRLRILRPEPSADRRDQHDGGNLSGRFLSRLRLVRDVFIRAAANSAEMPNPGVLTQFVGRSGAPGFQPISTTTTRTTISRAGTFRRTPPFRLQVRPFVPMGIVWPVTRI